MQIDWTCFFETDNDLLRQKVLNWFNAQGDDARIYENRVIADEQSFQDHDWENDRWGKRMMYAKAKALHEYLGTDLRITGRIFTYTASEAKKLAFTFRGDDVSFEESDWYVAEYISPEMDYEEFCDILENYIWPQDMTEVYPEERFETLGKDRHVFVIEGKDAYIADEVPLHPADIKALKGA